MEREDRDDVVVELGVASEETMGGGGNVPDLSIGAPYTGLSDD